MEEIKPEPSQALSEPSNTPKNPLINPEPENQKTKKLTKKQKKFHNKAKKKIKQAIKSIKSIESKDLCSIISPKPTKNVLIVHFGVGTENDFTTLSSFITGTTGVGDPLLDVYPGFLHAFLELKSTSESTRLLASTTDFEHFPGTPTGVRELPFSPRTRLVFFFYSKIEKSEILANRHKNELPNALLNVSLPGLIVIHNFISEAEEEHLITKIYGENGENQWIDLKKRRVQHYGHNFEYDINNVDRDSETSKSLPTWLGATLNRLNELCLPYNKKELDQLTINEYSPGQGIPPHVDGHSPFEEAVAILSLGSGVVMSFKSPSGLQRHVYLPRRSVYVITGEARFGWYHSIPLRKIDRVEGRVRFRRRRVSMTFRTVRDGPCGCDWPMFCDSRGYDKDFVKIPYLGKGLVDGVRREDGRDVAGEGDGLAQASGVGLECE